MEQTSPTDQSGKLRCKCNHCAGQFVIPSDMADSKLLCPHCMEEINHPEIVPAAGEEDKNAKSEGSSLPPAKKEKFVANRKFQPKPVPEAEQKFEDKVQSFVPAPKIAPEKIRTKNIQKKGSGVKSSFFLILLSAVFLTIAGVYYYKTSQLATGSEIAPPSADSLLVDTENRDNPYARMKNLITEEDLMQKAEVTGKDPILEAVREKIVKKEDLAQALSSLQLLYETTSVDEKLQHVFAPVETAEPMAIELRRNPLSTSATRVKPVQILDARQRGNVLISNVAYNDNSTKIVNFIYDTSKDIWLPDWFSLVQYQPIPYEGLLSTRPMEPVEVRAILGMSANYEKPFESSPRDTNYEGRIYINIDVTLSNTQRLRGYVDRHTPLYALLTKELMIGSVPATIKIKFPPSSSGARPDQVIITDIVHFGWLGRQASDASGNTENSK